MTEGGGMFLESAQAGAGMICGDREKVSVVAWRNWQRKCLLSSRLQVRVLSLPSLVV